MRRPLLTLALLAMPTSAHTRAAAPPAGGTFALPASPLPLAVVNVTVISATGEPARPGMTVVIRAGRIAAITGASAASLPAGARAIDGRGKFLIPGLWDMHAHVTHESFRSLYLASGVTGVRHMFSINPLFSPRGWKKAPPGGQPLAPRLVLSDTMVDGPRPVMPWWLRRNVLSVSDEAQARKAARAAHARGEDFVKVYPTLPRQAFLSLADEAGKLNLPLVGHVPHEVGVAEACARGMSCVEHLSGVALACSSDEDALRAALAADVRAGRLVGLDAASAWRTQVKAYDSFDPARANRLFRQFVQQRTWHVPTLVQKRAWGQLASGAFTDDPRLLQLPELLRTYWKTERTAAGPRLPASDLNLSWADLVDHRRQYRKDLALVEAMHRAGVRLMAGTDTPSPYCFPGSGLHDELELLVEAGLSPMQALQAATRNPAEFLGRQKDLGTVEAGKVADLVLLEADPLAAIGNTRSVAAVVLGGQFLDAGHLRALASGR